MLTHLYPQTEITGVTTLISTSEGIGGNNSIASPLKPYLT